MATACVSHDIDASVAELDLGLIKFKLTKEEGWTPEFADQVEVFYRRFLVLNARHPSRSIVPTRAIDTFWHHHILDTRKYALDCESVFGEFFHHFPYFGLRGDEDARNLRTAFDETLELFEREFGHGASVSLLLLTEPSARRAADGAAGCSDCDGGIGQVRPEIRAGMAGCSDCAGGAEPAKVGAMSGCSDCAGGVEPAAPRSLM